MPDVVSTNPHAAGRSDAGLIDTRRSPYAGHWFPPIHAVRLSGGFWEQFRARNERVIMPVLLDKLAAHGWLARYEIAAGKKSGPLLGLISADASLGKWLEAAAYVQQYQSAPELHASAQHLADLIVAAQDPNGYIDTAFMGERSSLRYSDLRHAHELYVFGHLIMAGVAHHRATAQSDLLNVAVRLADHVYSVFGPGQREGTCGHPGIEMALVELYRETGQTRYLDLARVLIDRRGSAFPEAPLHERLALVDNQPFRRMDNFTGAHAVRALYLACGAVDVYLETGDCSLLDAARRLWDDTNLTKTYITGAVGSRHTHESIGDAYELPNGQAYAETCSAIASVMWAQRMQAVEPRAEYGDVMETALYNCALGGVSLDGQEYLYTNPLESNAADGCPLPERSGAAREAWFDCPCCPTNLVRLLASVPGYIYGLGREGIYIHLYQASVLDWSLPNGGGLRIEQQTDYPWSGDIDVRVDPERSSSFTLFLRIPAWCSSGSVEVNGQVVSGVHSGSYLPLARQWNPGDRVRLRLDMPARYVEAHTRVRENVGSYALARGPLVYCLEGVDNLLVSPVDVHLAANGGIMAKRAPDVLGGAVTLQAPGLVPTTDLSGPLYRTAGAQPVAAQREVELVAVPYYARANRGKTWMKVWLPYRD